MAVEYGPEGDLDNNYEGEQEAPVVGANEGPVEPASRLVYHQGWIVGIRGDDGEVVPFGYESE